MKIALFGKHSQQSFVSQLLEFFNLLESKQVEVLIDADFYDYLKTILPTPPKVSDFIMGDKFEADFALSIGGDGTLLTTAKRVGRQQIPMVGINTGRLGYLSASDGHDLPQLLEELMEGRYAIEKRARLMLSSETVQFDYPLALNEVAITKRDVAAMLHIHASINGEYLSDYQADGLILSTATGSTAYSLSVGGPILMPENRSIILSPVAPHSLTMRPIVLSADSYVDLKVESRSKHYLVSLDGRPVSVPADTRLRVRLDEVPVLLVRREKQSFVETLRSKMMWGRDLRNGD